MGVRRDAAVVGHIRYLKDKKKHQLRQKLSKVVFYQQQKKIIKPTRKCSMENVPTKYQSFRSVESFPFIGAFSKQYFNIDIFIFSYLIFFLLCESNLQKEV